MSPGIRQPHAVLDLPSRTHKAQKIERLLGLQDARRPLDILEIGTGSGGIAHYFANRAAVRHRVDAVDIHDNRLATDGYRFALVRDSTLPFADHAFDVVLSNHVIEHLGPHADQLTHLRELRRVLRPQGLGYLAVPNRWQLVEPHYRLVFLSWLPESLRTPYLQLCGRGTEYDCRPLTVVQAERLFRQTGFHFDHLRGAALRMTFDIERPDSALYRYVLRPVPDSLWDVLGPVFPTLIYVLRPT